MAFATKYQVQVENPQSGISWVVNIQEDGFGGTVTQLDPGRDPFRVTYRTNINHPCWNWASSRCDVEFIDTTGALIPELFTAGERDYRIEVTQAGTLVKWAGYFKPGSYRSNLYQASISRITATDVLGDLRNTTYESAPDTPYTGQEKITQIIADCLEPLGLDLPLRTGNYIYAYVPTALDRLTYGNEDQLYHLTVNRDTYVSDNGVSWTCFEVLEDILKTFGLQLWQSNEKWNIIQRERPDKTTSGYPVFNYDPDGGQDTSVYIDSVPGLGDVTSGGYQMRGSVRQEGLTNINQHTSVHQHGQLKQLLGNLGFDDEGTPLPDWTLLGTGTAIERSSDTADGSDFSLEIPCNYTVNFDSSSGLNRGVSQTTDEDILAASGWKFRFQWRWKAPDNADLPSGIEFNLPWKIQFGSNYLLPDSSFTSTDTVNFLPIDQVAPYNGWVDFSIVTDELDTMPAAIGPLTIYLYGGLEENDGQGQTQNTVLYDDVRVQLLTADGDVVSEATVYTTTSDTVEGNTTLDTLYHTTGEGPLDFFKSALKALDVNETDIGGAGDWEFGSVPTSQTNKTLDEQINLLYLRGHINPLRVASGTLMYVTAPPSGLPIEPASYIYLEDADSTTERYYWWYNNLVWRPWSWDRLMEGQWANVDFNSAGTTTTTSQSLEDTTESGTGRLSGNLGSISVSNTTTTEVVDFYSDLASRAVGAEANLVYVKQYGAGSTLGGGLFLGDPSDSSTTTNNGTVSASSDGKRWRRVEAETGVWRTEWFGAVWDGTTDDHDAIEDLISAAADGTIIELPAATSLINEQILIDSKNLLFRGAATKDFRDDGRTGYPANPGGTIFQSGATLATGMFRVQDSVTSGGDFSQVSFTDIHFRGNNDNQQTDTHAVEFIACKRAGMIRCHVSNFTSAGVDTIHPVDLASTVECEELFFVQCTFAENGSNGLTLKTKNSRVERCDFIDNAGTGITEEVGSTGGNIFLNNVIQECGLIGIFLASSDGESQIIGNVIRDNDGVGIMLGSLLGPTVRLLVTNNTITGNGVNTLLGDTLRSGIVTNPGVTGAISNNILSDNGGYGLFLQGDYDISLAGNRGTGNGAAFVNTQVQNLDPGGWYSAIEHGMTQSAVDASLVLQDLIDTVPEGSTIVFPTGSYQFGSTVTLNKQLTLKGWSGARDDNTTGTLFTTDGVMTSPVLLLDNCDGAIIEGIAIRGGSAGAGEIGLQAIGSVSDVHIKDCAFYDFGGEGARVDPSAADVSFINCRFQGNGGSVVDQGIRTRFIDCTFRDNNTAELYLTSSTDARVTGCYFVDGDTGILINGGSGGLVQGNRINTMTGAGIKVVDGDRFIIQLNSVNNAGSNAGLDNVERSGVYLEGGTNIVVVDNDLSDSTDLNLQYGVAISATFPGSATILGNTGVGWGLALQQISGTGAGNVVCDLETVATLDFPNITAGDTAALTVTLTGARVGDVVKLGAPSGLSAGILFKGVVTSDNTITVTLYNSTSGSINESSADWSIHTERRNPSFSVPTPTGLTMIIQHQYKNTNLLGYG